MRRPPGTSDDTELALLVAGGQEWAFEELAERHSGLLRGIAGQFYAPFETDEDLMQYARIGFYKAAVTSDPSRGVRFRTFAELAVRAELVTAIVRARRLKHRLLNEAERFESPRGEEEGRTLAVLVPAPEWLEPEAQLLGREELEQLVDLVHSRLSPLEQAVLVRRLNGGTLEQCGHGLGRSAQGAAKTADNALQRIRRKLAT